MIEFLIKFRCKYVERVIYFLFFLCICFIILMSSKIISSMLTSVYNISSLEDSFDNLDVGDIIKYEINGYNEWRVLNIDKFNNTVDVTNKTNVSELTM